MDAQSGIRESEHRVPTFRRDDIVYDAKKDFIGEGEFGEVFKAKLGVEEKRVAVKVLRTPQRLTQAQISSLMKEATILQQIGNHPNIVRLLGVCIHPQHYAVVLHYSKCNLDRLIVEKKSEFPRVYEWPCRLQMAHGIACGMNYLHELTPPVIHRDLKSSNVLVSDENGFYRCRISDFGFAKMRGISSQTTRKSLRSFGSTCSTLPFIAPERFQGDAEISRKVDVYGYAIILWQLEEMKRPYAGETAQLTVRENVLAGVRPYLSKDNAPPPFQNLIIQCWAALPEKRPTFRGRSCSSPFINLLLLLNEQRLWIIWILSLSLHHMVRMSQTGKDIHNEEFLLHLHLLKNQVYFTFLHQADFHSHSLPSIPLMSLVVAIQRVAQAFHPQCHCHCRLTILLLMDIHSSLIIQCNHHHLLLGSWSLLSHINAMAHPTPLEWWQMQCQLVALKELHFLVLYHTLSVDKDVVVVAVFTLILLQIII
eukprot:m.41532 g.41532  ORF g.41532 m.41532 type:complete len:480 (+) comp33201_c0_seq2:1425-2864(+)